jgi:hypothetical protein
MQPAAFIFAQCTMPQRVTAILVEKCPARPIVAWSLINRQTQLTFRQHGCRVLRLFKERPLLHKEDHWGTRKDACLQVAVFVIAGKHTGAAELHGLAAAPSRRYPYLHKSSESEKLVARSIVVWRMSLLLSYYSSAYRYSVESPG